MLLAVGAKLSMRIGSGAREHLHLVPFLACMYVCAGLACFHQGVNDTIASLFAYTCTCFLQQFVGCLLFKGTQALRWICTFRLIE